MGAFHQGAEILEHLARKQMDESRKNRATCEGADRWGHFTRLQKNGAPCQGADRWGHIARRQKEWSILCQGQIDGCRKIRAPYQGEDIWGHFTRGRKDWSTLPGARWLGKLAHGG